MAQVDANIVSYVYRQQRVRTAMDSSVAALASRNASIDRLVFDDTDPKRLTACSLSVTKNCTRNDKWIQDTTTTTSQLVANWTDAQGNRWVRHACFRCPVDQVVSSERLLFGWDGPDHGTISLAQPEVVDFRDPDGEFVFIPSVRSLPWTMCGHVILCVGGKVPDMPHFQDDSIYRSIWDHMNLLCDVTSDVETLESATIIFDTLEQHVDDFWLHVPDVIILLRRLAHYDIGVESLEKLTEVIETLADPME